MGAFGLVEEIPECAILPIAIKGTHSLMPRSSKGVILKDTGCRPVVEVHVLEAIQGGGDKSVLRDATHSRIDACLRESI